MINVSVSVSVYYFCPLAYLENYITELYQISVHFDCGHGSELFCNVAICNLLLVLLMTSCFHTVQVLWHVMYILKWREDSITAKTTALIIKQMLLNDEDQPILVVSCALGAKPAVYNWLVYTMAEIAGVNKNGACHRVDNAGVDDHG